MKILVAIALSCVAANAMPAAAQMVQSQVTASNGVIVTVNTDDFAARQEFTSPSIPIKVPGSFVDSFGLVAIVKKAGVNSKIDVVGSIFYNGEWRYYDSAIFKGGDDAPFVSTGREVVSCSGGCSFSEGYEISLDSPVVARHAENGIIAIQIRPKASIYPVILEIPTSYIDAVREVAHADRPREAPQASAVVPVIRKNASVSRRQPNVASTPVTAAHVCTHDEQVQARIARQNGYTGGPKCN